jgi:2-phospho-L-lactate/phosphoenolpyruvate guanylyltransferase
MNNLFALVPIKDPVRGKSRLASVLSQEERRSLNAFLGCRALEVCTRVFGAERTLVVAGSAAAVSIASKFGVRIVLEDARQRNVNEAVAAGADCARVAGADAIMVVPTDLPLLTESSLQAAIAAIPHAPGCVLVPDHRGTGTNVIGLAPVRSDLFSFGEPSLERHSTNAKCAGYEVRIHHCDVLAFDLDRPEDLDRLEKSKAWSVFEFLIQSAASRRAVLVR